MWDRLRELNPLPEGSIPVAVGLVITGLATFVFFAITSRVLDADAYSALVVLWTLVFAVGNGVMQPLEQEVARAVADRRARSLGSAPVIRRATVIGLAFTGFLMLIAVAARSWLVDELFDGRQALFVAFLVGLVGFCVGHLVRGTLSSHGRFRAYGLFFGVDGLTRPLVAAVLAGLGVAAVGPYGMVIAVAPFVGAAVALRGEKGLLRPGPPAAWSELTAKLGWLLLGTGAIALLLNGGAVAITVLATEGQEDAAGVFQNALFIARSPLFLFQAVLVALLPKLSHQLGRGDVHGFTVAMSRLMAAILALGAVATVLAALIGPALVELLFGSEEVLGSSDLALLAAGSIVYLAAATLIQALIALNGHARMAVGAVVGFGAFLAVVAAGDDLFARVEWGLLVGSVVTAVWMAVFVVLGVRAHQAVHELDLAEAAAEVPLQP